MLPQGFVAWQDTATLDLPSQDCHDDRVKSALPSEEVIRAHVAQVVKTRLDARGWSQGDLARRLPGSLSSAKSRVSRLLQDRKPVSLAFIAELAEALGEDVAIFLEPVVGSRSSADVEQWAAKEQRLFQLKGFREIRSKYLVGIGRPEVGALVLQIVNAAAYMTLELIAYETEHFAAWSQEQAAKTLWITGQRGSPPKSSAENQADEEAGDDA